MQAQSHTTLPLPVALEYRLLETALLVLLAINTVSIVARYVFNHAIGELFEIMILGSVACYWLGIATAERERAHLGVSVLVDILPTSLQRVSAVVRVAVIAVFLGAVIYSSVLMVMSQYRFNMVSGILDLPLWVFAVFMPIGATLMLVRVIGNAWAGRR